jgi:hypothetical protein
VTNSSPLKGEFELIDTFELKATRAMKREDLRIEQVRPETKLAGNGVPVSFSDRPHAYSTAPARAQLDLGGVSSSDVEWIEPSTRR